MNRRNFLASSISIPLVSLQSKPLWAKDSKNYCIDFEHNRMWTKEGGIKYDISIEDARKYWRSKDVEKGYFAPEWEPNRIRRFRDKGGVSAHYSYPTSSRE